MKSIVFTHDWLFHTICLASNTNLDWSKSMKELRTTAGLLINASGLVILLSNLAQWHAG